MKYPIDDLWADSLYVNDCDHTVDAFTSGRSTLATRVRNTLVRAQIYTIDDLVKRTRRELLGIPYFGVHSLGEVKERLAVLGLKLAPTVYDEADIPAGAETWYRCVRVYDDRSPIADPPVKRLHTAIYHAEESRGWGAVAYVERGLLTWERIT